MSLLISDGVFSVPFPYRGVVILLTMFTSNFLILEVSLILPHEQSCYIASSAQSRFIRFRAAVSLKLTDELER